MLQAEAFRRVETVIAVLIGVTAFALPCGGG